MSSEFSLYNEGKFSVGISEVVFEDFAEVSAGNHVLLIVYSEPAMKKVLFVLLHSGFSSFHISSHLGGNVKITNFSRGF